MGKLLNKQKLLHQINTWINGGFFPSVRNRVELCRLSLLRLFPSTSPHQSLK